MLRHKAQRYVLLFSFLMGLVPLQACKTTEFTRAAGHTSEDTRDIETINADALLSTRVRQAFAYDAALQHLKIGVDTYEGVVRLWGALPNAQTIEHATATAQSIQGVRRVNAKDLVEK